MNAWGRAALGLLILAAGPADAADPVPVLTVQLAEPFHTQSAWRFVARQGSAETDRVGTAGGKVPGTISLCFAKWANGPCDTEVEGMKAPLRFPSDSDDLFADPHYLDKAEVTAARPAEACAGLCRGPLLLLQIASLHSADGDQRIGTELYRYDQAMDRFKRVYAHVTGQNNNQEDRYIATGPMAGDVVQAEPTQDAPFGYWITVEQSTDSGAYRATLRYRSATRYGDGNPLPVIDAEMPNIQKRLGLWRPEQPLPLPSGPCPKPHLVRTVLWCS